MNQLTSKEYCDFMKINFDLDVFEIKNNKYYIDPINMIIKIINKCNSEDDILAAPTYKKAHHMTLGDKFQIKYALLVDPKIFINPILKKILKEFDILVFYSTDKVDEEFIYN